MSKQIAYMGIGLLLLSILISFACIVFFPYSSTYAVQIVQAIIPAVVAVLTCYFGKAGLQNYNKIKLSQTDENNG